MADVTPADIQAAPVTKVADGQYRLEFENGSIDIEATSKADATARAVAWKLAELRGAKVAEIKAALAASDVWVVRNGEDGVSLTDARKQYRADLRSLIAETNASDDPASITLPAEPAFP